MYLLPCPHCQEPIEVAPSHAGDDATCTACSATVPIPKLGELRQLPRADEASSGDVAPGSVADSSGQQIGAAILGMIALVGILIGGYTAIRWFLIETPTTTQEHIDELTVAYNEANAAVLIREFENMEEMGLDLTAKYKYKTIALEKARWGWTALISGGLALIAAVTAMMLASTGRSTKPADAAKES
jgi:hypothetical protein